jgi:hypothetical protein
MHGERNDRHGPLKLNLTEEEGESARDMIDTFLEQADGLGAGVVASVWRAEAEELTKLFLEPAPAPVIQCACCDKPARDIGVHGLAVCSACAVREEYEVLDGPGGLSELRPLIDDRYTFGLLSGRALTVMDAHQLAAAGTLAGIVGIGPKRRAEIEEALRQHAEARRQDGGES